MPLSEFYLYILLKISKIKILRFGFVMTSLYIFVTLKLKRERGNKKEKKIEPILWYLKMRTKQRRTKNKNIN